MIFEVALEGEVFILFRLGHQIAGPFGRVGIRERPLVDVTRQHALDAVFDGDDDGVMFLAAVAAEEGCVKSCFLVVRIEALPVERNPTLP
jgi:hypothetical protein